MLYMKTVFTTGWHYFTEHTATGNVRL